MRLLPHRWQRMKDEAAEGSNVVGDDAVEAPFLGGTFNDLIFFQASWWVEAVAVLAQHNLTIPLDAAVLFVAPADVAVDEISPVSSCIQLNS